MIELYQIDDLRLYFGKDFKLNEYITIHQPTIGQIVEMGEREYFSMVQMFTAVPSDYIVQLWDMEIDWNQVEPFELFPMLVGNMSKETTKILFGDLDFTKFEIVPVEGERRHYLHHTELNFDFDELMYGAMVNYLSKMHGFKSSDQRKKRAGNEATKQMMVEMAREDLARAQKKPYKSQLKTLISALVNSSGFKYNLREIQDIGLSEFMDSVSRISIINSSQALLQGCYSGNIDMKKLDKKELNYMRDID